MKSWLMFLICITLSFVAAYFLRQNNLKMIELRDAVVAADKNGSDAQSAVNELGDYVLSHMNTSMNNPVQLPHAYNADYAELIKNNEEINTQEYNALLKKCLNVNLPVEVQSECIREQSSEGDQDPSFVLSPSLYSFDFKSPILSFDLAGLFSALTAVAWLIFVVKFITEWIIKKKFNFDNKRKTA